MGVSIDGFVGFPTVMAVPWELTEDGNESHFQQNYLAYFLLIRLLLDCMSPASRVVLVTASLRTEAPAPTWKDVGFAVG
jgi:NAD(P)-dependent dehydrogenase (short-subunit alcohol dehydrogenase family)